VSSPDVIRGSKIERGIQETEETYDARNDNEHIFIALERADVTSFAHVLASCDSSGPCTFIIGPEGGFSSREIELVKSIPNIQQVSLGRTVLRAETAAIVGMGAISMWRG
jgi:16S rRNA (uracil1498-N3)-methyltransferase